jgi:L-asparaginase II
MPANHLLIEVTRGSGVESVHRGSAAIVSAAGELVFSIGDIHAHHPAMREVTEALATVTATPLSTASAGVDGCSIPAFAIPLRALALDFARLGTGEGLTGPLATASGRIRAAMAAEPLMVAGLGRFDTRVAEACGGAILVKSGAEGVASGTIPGAGLGIAVKIDDGAGRAATAAMAALLLQFAGEWLDGHPTVRGMLEEFANPILRNWHGIGVGSSRATAAFGP